MSAEPAVRRDIIVCTMPHAGGWHMGSWRRPGARGNRIWDPSLWRQIARTAERGKLDAVFFADNLSLWPVPEHLRHHTAKVGVWDALVLATIAAEATEHIGIIATMHTEYHQPYVVARQMASLDHASRGRAGWNVVTSAPADALSFGRSQPAPADERYERAGEFVDVVEELWDSWEDDAYLLDAGSGIFYDPGKMHPVHHDGTHFSVHAALNIMRPVQGHPVIAQAGSSEPGRDLAARVGELLFTPLDGDAARAYREDVLARAAAYGRPPQAIKVISQLMPVVAPTRREAEAKWARLQGLLHPDLRRGALEQMLDINVDDFDLDEPLPELGPSRRVQGYRDAVLAFRKDGRRPTLRELLLEYPGPGTIVGTPQEIVDHMEREVDNGACDGFALLLQGVPEELDDFVELIVPELQRRGRLRTAYQESTLRERLGFERPRNRHAQTP